MHHSRATMQQVSTAQQYIKILFLNLHILLSSTNLLLCYGAAAPTGCRSSRTMAVDKHFLRRVLWNCCSLTSGSAFTQFALNKSFKPIVLERGEKWKKGETNATWDVVRQLCQCVSEHLVISHDVHIASSSYNCRVSAWIKTKKICWQSPLII